MDTSSKRLYYYCKLSTAIEKILPNRQLLLNPLGKTNDPREYKSFVFARKNISIKELVYDRRSDEYISTIIRKHCKMLCFSTDYQDIFGYEYSRMWALYADNHMGICIALDKEKFIEENKKYIQPELFKEIQYYDFKVAKPETHIEIDHEQIRNDGIFKYISEKFRPKNIDYLFFTKNKEWETERECRLIHISQSKELEYCTINNCIDTIYLGIDFNNHYLSSIKDKVPNIKLIHLDYKGVRLVPDYNTTIV
jgi:hypothetical protein